MITLLLDSSGANLSVGLAKNNVLIGSIEQEAFQMQSELMVDAINKLCTDKNINPRDINEVIVGIGPGSYTGVRIAVTIAKVIGLALMVPIYEASSLQIIAGEGSPSVCVMNARRKRSYVGVYFEGEALVDDKIITNDELNKYLEEHPTYLLTGDTKYLNKKSAPFNRFSNMLKYKHKLNKLDDPLLLNAIYLKD